MKRRAELSVLLRERDHAAWRRDRVYTVLSKLDARPDDRTLCMHARANNRVRANPNRPLEARSLFDSSPRSEHSPVKAMASRETLPERALRALKESPVGGLITLRSSYVDPERMRINKMALDRDPFPKQPPISAPKAIAWRRVKTLNEGRVNNL